MCSIKSLDIRLTDIWIESEKQMIGMKNKINYLNDYLIIIEVINKHLIKCNETLVSIIEKCGIDCLNDQQIIGLIDLIKDEEKKLISIKAQKQLNYGLNDENVIHIIESWRQCKQFKGLTYDKCIQTESQIYDQFVFDVIRNDVSNRSNDGPNQELVIRCDNESSLPNKININNNNNSINNSIIQMISSDFVLDNNNEHKTNSQLIDNNLLNNSLDESDFECKAKQRNPNKSIKNNRKKSTKKSVEKIVVQKSKQKRIDKLVLDFKVGQHFECNEYDCDFKTRNKKLFFTHFNEHKILAKDEKLFDEFKVHNKYECRESGCHFITDQKISFFRHYNQHKKGFSSETMKKIADQKNEEKKRIEEFLVECKVDEHFVCKEPECEFRTKTKRDFKRHFNKHEKDKKGMSSKSCPENPRPYVCEWPGCEWRFTKSGYLRAHKLRAHLNYKPIECDWPGCGFKLFDKFNYESHRRIHTKEKPLKCEWPSCEYRCSAKWSLVAHKRKHTGEKPYECLWPDCHYRCSQPGTLILHKRKHTGEKPYFCDFKGCNRRFAVLAGLHLHRPVHQKESNYTVKKISKTKSNKMQKHFN
jgi:hypothetical protein